MTLQIGKIAHSIDSSILYSSRTEVRTKSITV